MRSSGKSRLSFRVPGFWCAACLIPEAIEEIKGVQKELQDSAVNAKNIPRLLQLLNQTAGERRHTHSFAPAREDIKNENNELPRGSAGLI